MLCVTKSVYVIIFSMQYGYNSSKKSEFTRGTREFDKGKLEIVTLAGVIFGRATFQPGWKWSTSVKPIAKTNSCQSSHTQYIISGRMMVKMDDVKQVEFGPW